MNILRFWRPQVFHGDRIKENFFEGWFFKIVDKNRNYVYAFIPGVYIDKANDDSHAFIQILDGHTHQSTYHRFPIEQFFASTQKFEIRIDQNYFCSDYMSLKIESEERRVEGTINFSEFKPWPVKLLSPGIMGWYAFVPFMECYHGVLSFDHALTGKMQINGDNIDFTDGRGYVEKDWGHSFPSAYIWIQSNHFKNQSISLVASIAKIPWLKSSFRGFIIGLLFSGKLYRFATYTGAKLNKCQVTDKHAQIEVSDGKYMLKISAERTIGGVLQGPSNANMVTRISESLSSRVEVEFYRLQKNGKELLFKGLGDPAGLDVNGKLPEIVDNLTED